MKCKYGIAALMVALSVRMAVAGEFNGTNWICPAGFERATNATIEVRTTFKSSAAGRATLKISADSAYAVRLNGREVIASARLPDVPPWRLYDELTIEGVLKGENTLEFSVYAIGIDNQRYLSGHPGLSFELKGAGCCVTSADECEWRRSTADRADGVPISTRQIGFCFEYNALAKPENWQRVSEVDRPQPLAGATWEKRPFAVAEVLPFVGAKLLRCGHLNESAVPEDPAVALDGLEMLPGESESAANRWYLLDMGREETGLLELEVEATAGTVVDVGYGEHIDTGRVHALIGERHFSGRYRACDGRQQFCRWQARIAGRYLQVFVYGAKLGFKLHRVGMRPVLRTDVVERPVPEWLNARQTNIWKTAVRTLRLCMHEHYEDCPWREQALYANDGRNQILCGRFAFEDDGAFALHSLKLLSLGLQDDGWMELCMPCKFPITIPSFTFSWNLALFDYYRLYGYSKALEELLPSARKILEKHLAEMVDGLLPCAYSKRYWNFYDWAQDLDNWVWGPDGGQPGVVKNTDRRFDAPLNLLFLMSLETNAELVDHYGDGETAARWREAAAKLRTRIQEVFWNEALQQFDTYRGLEVKRNGHELTQSLAILADAVPEKSLRAVAERLSAPSDWVETTLSQSLHKFEALVKVDHTLGKLALKTLDDMWGDMLDRGATSFWETKAGWRTFGKAGSLCHGWSAVPIYFYAMHPELFPANERLNTDEMRKQTDVAARVPHINPWWAAAGFWDRRHKAKLREIATGPKEYDFVFLGDSITHNWEGWNDPIDIYVVDKMFKQDRLKFSNGPGRAVYAEMKKEFKLLNLGMAGDSTQHALWRLDHGEMDGYTTKGVMLMLGTNNSRGTPADVARGILAILKKIAEKQPQAKVLLLPVFPAGIKADTPVRLRNTEISRIIKGYADGERVIWCDFNDRLLEKDGTLLPEMMPDYLHPLENGYRIWRAAIEPYMRKIIGR